MLCGIASRRLFPLGRHPLWLPARMPLPPLSPEQLIKPRYFEARIALMFAALFVSTGVDVPYFPLGSRPTVLTQSGSPSSWLRRCSCASSRRRSSPPTPTRASDRANVLLVLVAAALVISCGSSCRRSTASCWRFAGAVGGVDAAGTAVELLALSGVRRFGSNYTVCASGVRSRSSPPISSAASSCPGPARRPCRSL